MSNNTVDLVENDTEPSLDVTYDDVDVTAFEALELHINYKPNPLVIAATLDETDETQFRFEFTSRISGELSAAAAVADTSVTVTITGEGQAFDDLPDTGEILIEDEHVLYSAKSGGDTLTLVSALTTAHASGVEFEKLPDLRSGTYKTEIEVVDADGGRLTFNQLVLKIDEEIA